MDNRHYEKFADGRVKDIEDEIPFAVPEGWAWCRLGEIGVWRAGSTPNRKNIAFYKNGTIPWLLTGDLNDGVITDIPNKITEEAYCQTSLKLNPTNSICIAMYGATIGKLGILSTPATTNQACCVCSDFKGISNKYLFYFLLQHRGKFVLLGFGGAQPNISKEKIIATFIPLPPLSEQHRIVTAIEAIFTQIELLEQNKADLQTAVKQAKSKILDLAIHGKLVPQDPNDEPASVMLEKLRAEKEAKIAAGKMKRDKNDSYIYKNAADNCYYEKIDGKNDIRIDDELLFELPKSWQWTKLGRICDKLIDGDHNPPKGIEEKTEYIMVSSRNINYNTVADLENVRYLTKEMFEAENLRTNATAGDILFTSVGSLGRSCIYDGSLNICFQRSVSILKTAIYNKYLKFFFDSKFYQNYVVEHATGTAQTGFYLQEMAESFIAIPPILEQKRIVAKIEELFNALDKIQNNLI